MAANICLPFGQPFYQFSLCLSIKSEEKATQNKDVPCIYAFVKNIYLYMYGFKALPLHTKIKISIAAIQKLSNAQNGFWELWIECILNLLTNFNRVSDGLAIEPVPCRKVVLFKLCYLYVSIRSKSVVCKKVNLVYIFHFKCKWWYDIIIVSAFIGGGHW